MNIIKGKGQRLIPEELLKYLEALKKKYPDAVDLIEANPTLEGGEESLSSVLINGTKYAVGGGAEVHLYEHIIRIKSTFVDEKYVLTSVIIDSSTPFTVTSFLQWLYQNHSSSTTALCISIGMSSHTGPLLPETAISMALLISILISRGLVTIFAYFVMVFTVSTMLNSCVPR